MIAIPRWSAFLLATFFFCPGFSAALQEDLAALSKRANALMVAGKFEEAIPLCRQLLKVNPDNTGLLLNLALAQHLAGHEREAIPNFETVLKRQPRSVPALISLGAARLSLNEPQQAVPPLQKAVGLDPKNAETRGMLAGALMDVSKFEGASEQYRALTELTPDDAKAWYGLGMSYQGMAGKAFEKLQQMDPTSPWVSALVADTRVQRRQFRSAFFFYQEALKKMPLMHGVHTAIAEVYRRTGHQEWAVEEDAKERALPPANCELHVAECQFLGGHDLQTVTLRGDNAKTAEDLYWREKAINELAMQAFFRLGQLSDSVESHQLRAEIARNQGQHLEAVKEWRAALAMAPRSARVRNELAVSLFMAQDFRSALSEAELLLKSNPRSPELNFLAGDSLLRLEDPEKAVGYLNSAIAANPQMLEAHASLGLALARTGKEKEAVTHLVKAIELDDDGSLHYQLARAYQAMGETEKARAAMAQYQEVLQAIQKQKEEVAREAQIGPPQ